MIDWQAITLTLQLAFVTMLCLLILATPLAWWLARSTHWSRPMVSALCTLPLVLPPTVLGFYLLVLLGPESLIGSAAEALNLGPLVFSFTGLVIGSILYSLPFALQPLVNAFQSIDPRLLEVAATLRSSKRDQFLHVVMPLSRAGFISAAVLSFAHTLGEFGVILMIGGNIPGETRVLSIAIYEHVEALEFAQAHVLSGAMLVVAFLVLLTLQKTNLRPLSAAKVPSTPTTAASQPSEKGNVGGPTS